MKERLLELIVCPECGETFRLSEEIREAEEIISGMLGCRGGHLYPVVHGIPRLLDAAMLRETLERYHPEQWALLRHRLAISPEAPMEQATGQTTEQTTARTLRSFSYQWNIFSDMFEHWEENFRSYFEPLVTKAEFAGKLVLDAGCGFGRHAYYSGSYGAEVVAMDLSEAVEAAYENTRHLPKVHVIQGNIYQPPLADRFDLVYCVGVIQHLPDPAAGFASLARRLRPGGRIFVWVYGRRQGIYKIVDAMRRWTTNMSMASLYRLTWMLNLLSYGAFCVPHRLLRAVPGLRGLARHVPFTRYADLPLRVGHADWFDRLGVPSTVYFHREDVEAWYESARLADVELSSRDGIGWRAIGSRAIGSLAGQVGGS